MEIAQAASISGQRAKSQAWDPPGAMLWAFDPIRKAPMVSTRDVTALFGDWSRGNRAAINQLQPTALVHEVFIRLVDQPRTAASSIGCPSPGRPCLPIR